MNRLWSRVAVRAASVGLLLTGAVGGFYLGQDDEIEPQAVATEVVLRADTNELRLLKERHAQHAAARAPQRVAEADAAKKAAKDAKAAASKARKLQKAAIAKKAKEKAEAEAEAEEKAEAEPEKGGGSGPAGGPYTGPIPSSCNEYSGNIEIGCALMVGAGFKISQFPCLNQLWDRESGWNEKAYNSGSGAQGIPQALPGRKMASAGSDWRTNPATQIKWGLSYIKGRYGSPCSAWSHSERVGWY